MQKQIILLSVLLFSCKLELDNPASPGDKSNIAMELLKCALGQISICSLTAPSGLLYATPIVFKNNISNSFSPTVSGSSLTFSINPSLPLGLLIDPSTGIISGKYTSYEGTISNHSITATNTAGATNFSIKILSYGMEPLKTGQTACQDNLGNLIGCAATGQDAEYQRGSTVSFLDNSDGTVKDNLTGLLWQKCELGGTYTIGSNTCTVPGTASNFVSSSTGCTATSGFRQPTIFEMRSISKIDNTLGFYSPFTLESNNYWTSVASPSGHFSMLYSTLNYSDSPDSSGTTTTKCVSGSSITSKNSFLDNFDGTITDVSSGLLWRKCPIGQSYSGGSCIGTITKPTWDIALTNCVASGFLGKSWRHPNINELASLFHPGFSNYIDPTFFPTVGDTAGSFGFWSSTGVTTAGRVIFFSSTSPSFSTAPKTTGGAYASLCVSGP
jgi:hypothetical protein